MSSKPGQWVPLVVALGAFGCQAERREPDETEVVVAQSQINVSLCRPVSPPYTQCAEVTIAERDWSRWPGGVIKYRFEPGYPNQTDLRAVMDDWTRMSGGVITFVDASSETWSQGNPIVTIVEPKPVTGGTESGLGRPYADCTDEAACFERMFVSQGFHELGHAIGFPHQWQRFDRPHYLRMYKGVDATNFPCDDGQWQRMAGPVLDYGPFNRLSALNYGDDFPQVTWWNGDSLLASTMQCGKLAHEGEQVSLDCQSSSLFCATCTGCAVLQPGGLPTREDGAAVAELYRNLFDPGWRKFVRTINPITSGSNATVPYNYSLTTGVNVPADATPAISYRPVKQSSNPQPVREIFVRGSDSNIYQKRLDGAGFSASWTNLGKPTGAAFVTDPGAVSWDGGRTDLAVTAGSNPANGGAVWVKSYTGSWGSWQSLGFPTPTGVASPPSITSSGLDRLEVFVRGTDNRLYTKSCTANCTGGGAGWSSTWTQIGGAESVRGRPAVVSRGGTIDLVVANGSGDLRRTSNANWTSWSTVPFAVPSGASGVQALLGSNNLSPALGSHTASSIDLYVRGNDDKVWWSQCQDGSPCGAFAAVGGVLTSSPASLTKGWNDRMSYLAVTMPEQQGNVAGSPNRVNGVWVKAFDDNHSAARKIALANNSDGRLEGIFNGVGDVLYRKAEWPWQNNPVLLRTAGSRGTAKQMAIARNKGGELGIVYVTTSNEILYVGQKSPGGQYGNPFALPGGGPAFAKQVALTTRSNDTLQVIFIGNDDVLWEQHQTSPTVNSTWTAPSVIAGSHKAKQFAVSRDSNGGMEVIFTEMDDVVWHARQTSLITPWANSMLIGVNTRAKQVAAALNFVGTAPDRIEVVYSAQDDVLYRTAQTSAGSPSWTAPTLLNASYNKAKQIVMARNEDNRLEVFYTILDDFVRHTWQNSAGGSTWSGEQDMPGTPKAASLAIARNGPGDDRLELFWVGLDDATYHMWQVAKNSDWTQPASW